jgi:SAM-dependent methyltransferase
LSTYLIFQNDQVLVDALSYYFYLNVSFDHIIIEDAIGYFHNPNYIFDLIKKLLSPLGKLIVKCPLFKEPPVYNINYFNIHCMNQLCKNHEIYIAEVKKTSDANIFIIQSDPPTNFNIFDEIYNEMDTTSY